MDEKLQDLVDMMLVERFGLAELAMKEESDDASEQITTLIAMSEQIEHHPGISDDARAVVQEFLLWTLTTMHSFKSISTCKAQKTAWRFCGSLASFGKGAESVFGNDFEKAFSDFMERREYDRAENALFSMVRIAFAAGRLAAGGKPPKPQKIFTIVHRADIPKDGIDTDLKTE